MGPNGQTERANITRGIWTNLFTNFGRARVDNHRAAAAYRALHEQVWAAIDAEGPACWIAHVTTNYDPAIEVAIGMDDRLQLLDGFSQLRGGGSQIYNPEGIADRHRDATDRVPVLHLHGAVGWYQRSDGQVTRLAADEGYDDRRTPALLLPDNRKDPLRSGAATQATWHQFVGLLNESTHVLLIGHSLHDRHLLEALRQRQGQVAVVIYTDPDSTGQYPAASGDETERFVEALPHATLVPGRFGQLQDWPDIDRDALGKWLRRRPDPMQSARDAASRARCRRRSTRL